MRGSESKTAQTTFGGEATTAAQPASTAHGMAWSGNLVGGKTVCATYSSYALPSTVIYTSTSLQSGLMTTGLP